MRIYKRIYPGVVHAYVHIHINGGIIAVHDTLLPMPAAPTDDMHMASCHALSTPSFTEKQSRGAGCVRTHNVRHVQGFAQGWGAPCTT